jgi:hypothetical protein
VGGGCEKKEERFAGGRWAVFKGAVGAQAAGGDFALKHGAKSSRKSVWKAAT